MKNRKLNYNKIIGLILSVLFFWTSAKAQENTNAGRYLAPIQSELKKEWPNNRTINLVFHGHSVPSGYFNTPNVKTLVAYPNQTLIIVKEEYPYAVVNSITTAIGGEQSEQGAKRFLDQVLNHRPDVLFIDYALNDRSIGLERAKKAWDKMIEQAKRYRIKIILMTPTPDLKEDILSSDALLAKHSDQIRELANTHEVGLVDSYALFGEIAKQEDLKTYMAQNNHINEKGHQVVANAIFQFFQMESK